MSSNLFLMALMLIAGGLAATQSTINARLAGALANPMQASFVSFCVGAIALLALLMMSRQGLPAPARLARLPPSFLAGGLCGVAFITTAIFLVPRVGVVNVLFVGLAGQMMVSVAIDHYGFFGLARHPINPWKVAGIALIALGIVMLRHEAAPAANPTIDPLVATARANSGTTLPCSPFGDPPARSRMTSSAPTQQRVQRHRHARHLKANLASLRRTRAA